MADTDINTPAPVDGDKSGTQPNGEPTPTAAAQQPVEKTFTQTELNAAIEARIKREREKGERETQKARDEAIAEAAKKNGDWQKLAERHEARIKELEPITAQLEQTQAERDALNGVVANVLKAQREGRSADELELLDMVGDPLKQLDWLTKHPPASKPFARVPGTPLADDAKKLSESEIKRRQAEATRFTRQNA